MMIPVWGMFGESSACNDNINGVNVFQDAVQGMQLSLLRRIIAILSFLQTLSVRSFVGRKTIFFYDDIKGSFKSINTLYSIVNVSESSIQLWEPGNNYYIALLLLEHYSKLHH